MRSVNCTTMGARQLGRMCRHRMRDPLLPRARAAATCSVSFTACAVPWAIRAKLGMVLTPTAIATLTMPGPRALTTAMASRKPGKASTTSTARMRISSSTPPRSAATSPTVTPAPAATRQAPKAMPSEMRAPERMRERMSRPSSSRPSPWLHDGPPSDPSSCCFSGSRGATQGPKAAMRRKNSTRARPAMAARLRAKRRHAAAAGLVLDARVGIPVQDVRGQIDEHGDKGHEQDRALDHREIPHADRLDDEPADAGKGEHGLHEHRAREHEPELERHHRDDGQERVAEGVAADDQALPDTLGARGPDVVLVEHVDHAGPGHPRHD